jgi:hypothetical protein
MFGLHEELKRRIDAGHEPGEFKPTDNIEVLFVWTRSTVLTSTYAISAARLLTCPSAMPCVPRSYGTFRLKRRLDSRSGFVLNKGSLRIEVRDTHVAMPFVPMDYDLASGQPVECPTEAAPSSGAARPCIGASPTSERLLSRAATIRMWASARSSNGVTHM